MKKIAIIGSSDLAKIVINQVNTCKENTIYGIYDDYSSEGKTVSNIKVIGKLNQIEKDFTEGKFDCLFVAVGYSRMNYRESVFNQFKNNIPFTNIIHDSCIVDKTVKLGRGILLLPGVLLDKGVEVKDNVLLNVGVTIAHDSVIKEHCFLGPRVTIAGFSEIGSKCYIGTNATIIDNIKVCSNSILGAGTVVIDNIVKEGLYVGVPSKKVK